MSLIDQQSSINGSNNKIKTAASLCRVCGADGQQWFPDEPGDKATECGSGQQRAGGETTLRPAASLQ